MRDEIVEEGQHIRHINLNAGQRCPCLIEHRGERGVVINDPLTDEDLVAGSQARVLRNLGNIHGVRHDQGAGAFGVQIGEDLRMVGQRTIHGVVPCDETGHSLPLRQNLDPNPAIAVSVGVVK